MALARSLIFLCYSSGASFLLLGAAGCAAMQSEVDSMFAKSPEPDQQATAVASAVGPSYVVMIRYTDGTAGEFQVPLRQVTYVQNVLQESGTLRRFRRMDIELIRPLDAGGHQRLKIRFDRTKRSVPPAYDYAIHPGDRLIITEDDSTVLDDMLESVAGPLGLSFKR